jgi:CBS domain-containing protein
MPETAEAIMTRTVVTAGPNDTVTQVAQVLSRHAISAVPICNERGNVLGMLSEGDLMRPFGHATTARRAWWLSLLAEGEEVAPAFLDYIRMDKRRARDLMSTPVITATPKTSVPELADLLARYKIKRAPVLQEGRLIGIVSRGDILRSLAHAPEMAAD